MKTSERWRGADGERHRKEVRDAVWKDEKDFENNKQGFSNVGIVSQAAHLYFTLEEFDRIDEMMAAMREEILLLRKELDKRNEYEPETDEECGKIVETP